MSVILHSRHIPCEMGYIPSLRTLLHQAQTTLYGFSIVHLQDADVRWVFRDGKNRTTTVMATDTSPSLYHYPSIPLYKKNFPFCFHFCLLSIGIKTFYKLSPTFPFKAYLFIHTLYYRPELTSPPATLLTATKSVWISST